jgi:hypothetical protein
MTTASESLAALTRGNRFASPTRDTARARAAELLGRPVEGDPLDAWLIANHRLTVGAQADALGVSQRNVKAWRAELSAAGRLPERVARRYDLCPICEERQKRSTSRQCETCAGRVRRKAPAPRQQPAVARRVPHAGPYHAPGGPPLSDLSARALALAAAASAAGELDDVRHYRRRYLAARARDWGVVEGVNRKAAA